MTPRAQCPASYLSVLALTDRPGGSADLCCSGMSLTRFLLEAPTLWLLFRLRPSTLHLVDPETSKLLGPS